MDAFAVSIGKGLSLKEIRPRHALSAGVWFGGFQVLMPIIGFFGLLVKLVHKIGAVFIYWSELVDKCGSFNLTPKIWTDLKIDLLVKSLSNNQNS